MVIIHTTRPQERHHFGVDGNAGQLGFQCVVHAVKRESQRFEEFAVDAAFDKVPHKVAILCSAVTQLRALLQ